MILMIDNYDSFTYNLVQYLGELGEKLIVKRNDEISLDQIRRMKPDRIVISPGPGTPRDAGISEAVIRTFGPSVPLLGVCLGHQAIGEVYGGKIVIADRIMHGKTSEIFYEDHPLFNGIENPFVATRYHSLVIQPKSLPKELRAIARTSDDEIMAVAHVRYPMVGVQFHPESILTTSGKKLLSNFLKLKNK
jgi:anthranilate synthase/aminodeoxychorismate synthase-like glutamine amidotransferase